MRFDILQIVVSMMMQQKVWGQQLQTASRWEVCVTAAKTC